MAIFRSRYNADAFTDKPQQILEKNIASGEVITIYDEFPINTVVASNDVVWSCEIPANSKVLSLRVVNTEDIATGVYTAGYTSNTALGDKTSVVTASTTAFLAASTLAAGTPEHVMTSDAAGFLLEFNRPVFLQLVFTTAPTVLDAKKIRIVMQVIGK